jgi:glutamate synthase (NADPH/NADH) large chain
MVVMAHSKRPGITGLYDPRFEHENCGVGFVAHIKGIKSHSIVEKSKEILLNMAHRGAVGSEKNTGDGAGIMTVIPHDFFASRSQELGFPLPPQGRYACGLVFLPVDPALEQECRRLIEEIAAEEEQSVLGWREVPRNNSGIGPSALASEPKMKQLFIQADDDYSEAEFERKLFIIRKAATHRIRGSEADPENNFYICSLSPKVIVYKGMLMPEQLFSYFGDLSDPAYVTHIAMVHSRFSTNTFPSWDRAQPLRYMCHNGEINTLRGNINKMKSREGTLKSPLFRESLEKAFPVIEADLSDSGNFDNALELLMMSGRSLQEAIIMMIPEAWQHHRFMPDYGRHMYEFFSCLMEPWDGPASIAFTDGRVIGAVLDRNGLRPSRYYVTTDDVVVMASEVGVLDIADSEVKIKGRLQPGMMFFVDFEKGKIIDDNEVKTRIALQHPYGQWLTENRLSLKELIDNTQGPAYERSSRDEVELRQLMQLFSYTREQLFEILKPMVENAKEPLGSMGNDAPLACLSDKPRLIYDYFKQLFAQVTNPPIDSIREDIVMSMDSYIGPEKNLLEVSPAHAGRLRLKRPILTNKELHAVKYADYRGWKTKTIDITYPVSSGGMRQCIERISREAEAAIDEGYSLLLLSDRKTNKERLPLSALIACASVHHYLVKKSLRTQIGIVVESAEPRDTHQFCMLSGYGADAVNPYMAFEVMSRMRDEGKLDTGYSDAEIAYRYIKALEKGMRKVFGKMGISTLESYKGAQIFEAVGLSAEVIDRCFTGTASRIGGLGFRELADDARKRHLSAYPVRKTASFRSLDNNGDLQYRRTGERHMWDPESIAHLQKAVKQNDPAAFKVFSERQNRRSKEQTTLRGLLRFRPGKPIPLSEVEAAEVLMTRFVTGAMSFGSLSQEAHETLAIAMNRIGGKSNTGEGGESSQRFKTLANGDSKRSAIKQIASGRFGVSIHYLTNSDEIQIKMAQGAKPGEGGELPGHKVFDIIAKTRNSTPGVGLISPPPHHDIYSIEDLAQLIFDLKNSNPKARISVKLVSECGVGTIAAGVAKAHADHILISGHDGGTGASPLTGIKHAGLPWELGLAETHQTLVLNDLRSRVVLQTDGQLKTGRDVVIAALLGAEECGFSTAPLISLGCVMMRKCQKNTCPVGIATQDERLRQRFLGRADYVVRYFRFVAEEAREIMASLGIRSFEELVGRVDLLETDTDVFTEKTAGIDLSALLTPAQKPSADTPVTCSIVQEHGIDDVLDKKLISLSERVLLSKSPLRLEEEIRNTDRAVGTMVSNHITRRWGEEGLPEDTLYIKLKGSAGQSFAAWLCSGVSLELVGDANDYVGKGLSGGKIIVYPPERSAFSPEENIIVGNVALYGAIRGQAFFRGRAAERFCVRNSGADVVVEGIGDHGCEYMTGGTALILGPVGRNFGAGMSGGVAYVWDRDGELRDRINPEMVRVEPIENPGEIENILQLLTLHIMYTGSDHARMILNNWNELRGQFARVISPVYKKIMQRRFEPVKELVNG